jgi:adenosylcobinamide-phosphate synthase
VDSFLLGAPLGYALDAAIGDPRRGHPVAAFGRAAGRLEQRVYADHRAAGLLFTAACVGTVAAGAAAGRALSRRTRAAEVGYSAAAVWAVLGGATLAREARVIGALLADGDIPSARERLPHLCGRDPRYLDEAGIARAVVESVAENTADAVVNALVWGALAGAPGLLAFRAVNTLDAMVGHRSPRYRRFGWASARLDDAAGWPGARLTALLAAATAAPEDRRRALRVWRRDGGAHPSPNAGQAESAFAGALGVRLGGELKYGQRVEHRPVLGAELRAPERGDIERACVLSRRVGLLALGASLLGRAAVAAAGRRIGTGAGR